MSLQNILLNLPVDELKRLDDIIMLANIAYSAGNDRQARHIFRREKMKASGKMKKLLAAFQKSDNLELAFKVHFENK